MSVRGVALALLDAVDCGPGSFLGGLVFACGLAQMRRIDGHIEHVVDDLEGESGFAAEGVEAGNIVGGRRRRRRRRPPH